MVPGFSTPHSPRLGAPALGPQSFHGAVDLLSTQHLSAKLGRSGTSSSFGIQSAWVRGARSCLCLCRAPAALVCGISSPHLFQSQAKGPFLPMARSEGGNEEFTGLVTKFRHSFLKSHLSLECVVMVQFAAELSPEGLLSRFPVPRGLALQSRHFTVHPPYGSHHVFFLFLDIFF